MSPTVMSSYTGGRYAGLELSPAAGRVRRTKGFRMLDLVDSLASMCMKAPAVHRRTLRFLAGIVWCVVGLALSAVAVYWLVTAPGNRIAPLLIGLIVGQLVYRFGFLRLARENKARISAQALGKDKVCLFAFQNWRSYVIIVVMMALGYTLRHLPISRLYLAPIYLAIGLGLFLASLHYYSGAE